MNIGLHVAARSDQATAGAIWGMPVAASIKPAALDSGICPIRTYIETMLELRFPESAVSLYPVFFGSLRRAMRALGMRSLQTGTPATAAEAEQVLNEQFPESKWGEHQHFELYRREARRTLHAFAAAFRPGVPQRLLDPEHEVAPSGSGIQVRLDLIARFVDQSGIEVVIGFRPESLNAKLNKRGAVNWSGIKDHAQIPFVLMWKTNPRIEAQVFSGADGAFYKLEWHARNGMPKAVEEIVARHRALAENDFTTAIVPYKCDRCHVRVTCPYWIGAIP